MEHVKRVSDTELLRGHRGWLHDPSALQRAGARIDHDVSDNDNGDDDLDIFDDLDNDSGDLDPIGSGRR